MTLAAGLLAGLAAAMLLYPLELLERPEHLGGNAYGERRGKLCGKVGGSARGGSAAAHRKVDGADDKDDDLVGGAADCECACGLEWHEVDNSLERL